MPCNRHIVRPTHRLTGKYSEKQRLIMDHSTDASLHARATVHAPDRWITSHFGGRRLSTWLASSVVIDTTDISAFHRAIRHIRHLISGGKKENMGKDVVLDTSVGSTFGASPVFIVAT